MHVFLSDQFLTLKISRFHPLKVERRHIRIPLHGCRYHIFQSFLRVLHILSKEPLQELRKPSKLVLYLIK